MPNAYKEFHFINVHKSIKLAVDLMFSQATETRKRLFLHSKIEDMKNSFDLDLFPLEYGGKIPIAEMVEEFKKELEETSELLKTYDQVMVNHALLLKDTRGDRGEVSGDWSDIDKDCFGVQGSFRKLEID